MGLGHQNCSCIHIVLSLAALTVHWTVPPCSFRVTFNWLFTVHWTVPPVGLACVSCARPPPVTSRFLFSSSLHSLYARSSRAGAHKIYKKRTNRPSVFSCLRFVRLFPIFFGRLPFDQLPGWWHIKNRAQQYTGMIFVITRIFATPFGF